MSKTLLILALGLLAVFLGFRSLSGYETETTHLYGGDFVTLTCDADGNPVSGAGWASLSADRACATQQSDQRGHANGGCSSGPPASSTATAGSGRPAPAPPSEGWAYSAWPKWNTVMS